MPDPVKATNSATPLIGCNLKKINSSLIKKI